MATVEPVVDDSFERWALSEPHAGPDQLLGASCARSTVPGLCPHPTQLTPHGNHPTDPRSASGRGLRARIPTTNEGRLADGGGGR